MAQNSIERMNEQVFEMGREIEAAGVSIYGERLGRRPDLVYAARPLYVYVTGDNKSEIQKIMESSRLVKHYLERMAHEHRGVRITRLSILGKKLTIEYDNFETSVFRGNAYRGVIQKLKKYALPT